MDETEMDEETERVVDGDGEMEGVTLPDGDRLGEELIETDDEKLDDCVEVMLSEAEDDEHSLTVRVTEGEIDTEPLAETETDTVPDDEVEALKLLLCDLSEVGETEGDLESVNVTDELRVRTGVRDGQGETDVDEDTERDAVGDTVPQLVVEIASDVVVVLEMERERETVTVVVRVALKVVEVEMDELSLSVFETVTHGDAEVDTLPVEEREPEGLNEFVIEALLDALPEILAEEETLSDALGDDVVEMLFESVGVTLALSVVELHPLAVVLCDSVGDTDADAHTDVHAVDEREDVLHADELREPVGDRVPVVLTDGEGV